MRTHRWCCTRLGPSNREIVGQSERNDTHTHTKTTKKAMFTPNHIQTIWSSSSHRSSCKLNIYSGPPRHTPTDTHKENATPPPPLAHHHHQRQRSAKRFRACESAASVSVGFERIASQENRTLWRGEHITTTQKPQHKWSGVYKLLITLVPSLRHCARALVSLCLLSVWWIPWRTAAAAAHTRSHQNQSHI